MLFSGGAVTVPLLPDVVWLGENNETLVSSTTRHLSPRILGKVYEAYVRSAIGSETWGPNNPEMQRLRCNNRGKIRWICGIKDRDEATSSSPRWKLDTNDVTSVIRWRRPRWYGHVQQATSCIKTITNFPIPGTKKRRRPRKTWSECVKTNVNNVAWLALTHKIEMHGETVFNIAWCYQPHRMGHLRHSSKNGYRWMDGI